MGIIAYTPQQKLRLLIMDGDPVDTTVPRMFTDDQLETFLSYNSGDQYATALYCIDRMIMYYSKRFDYKQGETQVVWSQVVKQLQEQKKAVKVEMEEEASNGGMVMAETEVSGFDNASAQTIFTRTEKYIKREI